jgi:hypothetical protein
MFTTHNFRVRAHGPDPRYKYLPEEYPAPLGRCCAGVIRGPFDIHPLPCEADQHLKDWADERAHLVSVKQLARRDIGLVNRLKRLSEWDLRRCFSIFSARWSMDIGFVRGLLMMIGSLTEYT